MSITRSCLLRAALAVTLALPLAAAAQEGPFPSRPIELVVPYPPGGGTDVVARIVAQAAEPLLGQRVLVVNKPGAGGTMGTQAVARAKPDGYTIGLVVNHPMVIMPHVTQLAYKPADFAPITQVTQAEIVFCSRPDFPARDAKELIAYARQNPDKLTYAGDGIGGTAQVLGERIFQALGVKLRLIPYKGAGESVIALLGNQTDLYGGSVPPVLAHVATGRVKCLMLTSREHSPSLPGVMGARDLGVPEQGSSVWHGLAAPVGTPRDRMAVLEKAFRIAVAQSDVQKRLQDSGVSVVGSSSEDFAKAIAAEYASFAELVKKLDLKEK